MATAELPPSLAASWSAVSNFHVSIRASAQGSSRQPSDVRGNTQYISHPFHNPSTTDPGHGSNGTRNPSDSDCFTQQMRKRIATVRKEWQGIHVNVVNVVWTDFFDNNKREDLFELFRDPHTLSRGDALPAGK